MKAVFCLRYIAVPHGRVEAWGASYIAALDGPSLNSGIDTVCWNTILYCLEYKRNIAPHRILSHKTVYSSILYLQTSPYCFVRKLYMI
jgi:hypothetical protein